MTQTYQASDLQSPIARRPMPPLALGHEDSTIFGLVIRGPDNSLPRSPHKPDLQAEHFLGRLLRRHRVQEASLSPVLSKASRR